jgi:glyoxylase-like metal-dependent hydrolase (beta-lactamase superfamily II)
MSITRRAALAITAAAAAPVLPASAQAPASVPKAGRQSPGFFRFNIGDIEVTTLHDGQTNFEVNAGRFPNANPDDVIKLMESQFIPARPGVSPFNTVVVNTGGRLVLIDSGFNNNGAPTTGRMAENMVAAGINPAQISTVLVSHFHPDHINGIRNREGQLVYPNAELIVHGREIGHYMDDARMSATPEGARGPFTVARRVFSPIMGSVKQAEWGKEWAPGITAVQSDGHTPGHTSFVISSGNRTLLVMGDAVNDPRVFGRNPDWHFGFDMDRAGAVATRKRMLDMASADRMQVSFYHASFPATGHIVKNGNAYDWFPLNYSSVL